MVDSINNSSGVLGALRYLQSANQEISAAESRLSSGLKVEKARDGAASFQSAALMRGEEGSLKAVSLSLSHAKSVSDMAIAAGEQVSQLLSKMRETAMSAMAPDLTNQQRAIYSSTFEDQRKQLVQFIESASFDDANLLDGSRPGGVSFIADADARQVLTLAGRDFRPGGGVVTILPNEDLADSFAATAVYDKLTQSIANVGDQLTQMSSESRRVTAQIGFVSKLADALAGGVGRLVDTDLAAESALVQALQVRQQLSAQAISIINEAPQSLLSLFRP